jgi:hypothetical protein
MKSYENNEKSLHKLSRKQKLSPKMAQEAKMP